MKWTNELVAKEALKYKTRFEFLKASNDAYQYAGKNNLLNRICSHMEPVPKIPEEVLESLIKSHDEAESETMKSDKPNEADKAIVRLTSIMDLVFTNQDIEHIGNALLSMISTYIQELPKDNIRVAFINANVDVLSDLAKKYQFEYDKKH